MSENIYEKHRTKPSDNHRQTKTSANIGKTKTQAHTTQTHNITWGQHKNVIKPQRQTYETHRNTHKHNTDTNPYEQHRHIRTPHNITNRKVTENT